MQWYLRERTREVSIQPMGGKEGRDRRITGACGSGFTGWPAEGLNWRGREGGGPQAVEVLLFAGLFVL